MMFTLVRRLLPGRASGRRLGARPAKAGACIGRGKARGRRLGVLLGDVGGRGRPPDGAAQLLRKAFPVRGCAMNEKITSIQLPGLMKMRSMHHQEHAHRATTMVGPVGHMHGASKGQSD